MDTEAPAVTASAKIQAYAEDNSNPAPTLEDYTTVGVTGVTAANLSAYNALVDAKTGSDVDTISELNALVDDLDTEAPVVTAEEAKVTVPFGGTYTDAGATVSDNVDTGLTATASGTVDVNLAGDYTITYSATDAAGNTGTATTTVTVSEEIITITVVSPLKTGQTASFLEDGTEGVILDDGHYKKGVVASFTRDAETNTTTDNNTGLVWEDNVRNTVFVNETTTGSILGISDYCQGDWNIPTMAELKTIVDYSKMIPAIDETAFINNVADANAKYFRAIDSDGTSSAHSINFETGQVKIADGRAIRCVNRTNSKLVPDIARDDATDTVVDNFRKLVWQDNAIGLEVDETKTWTNAIAYCEGLDGEWRLPNINELESIADRETANMLNGEFTNLSPYQNGFYWSSTTSALTYTQAWGIEYGISNGASTPSAKANQKNVRCVKDLVE